MIFGGGTGSMLGLQLRPAVTVAQTAFCAGLAWVALSAHRDQVTLRRRWATALMRYGPAMVLVLASVALFTVGNTRFAPVAGGEPLTCRGEKPRLCLASDYLHWEPELRRSLVPVLSALGQLEVGQPPETLVQAREDSTLPAGTAHVPVPPPGEHGADLTSDVAFELVKSYARCEVSQDDQRRALNQGAMKIVASEWIIRTVYPGDQALPPWFVALTPDAQLDWVRRAMRQLQDCKLDNLPAPAPPFSQW